MADEFETVRAEMVREQLCRRGIRDEAVLTGMGRVPREAFVQPAARDDAYADRPLPIAAGQTISQPYVVALMAEAAAIRPGDRVLEIGAGSGYAAAVFAELVGSAGKVLAIERQQALVTATRARLARLGYDRIELIHGDGSTGLADAAPFDAIIVSAGGPEVPQMLTDQLAPGGRLVMPVGSGRSSQSLIKITRSARGALRREDLGPVSFVPLIGEGGWPAP